MQTEIQADYRLDLELRKGPDAASAPLLVEEVTQDVVRDLTLETFMHGVLAGQLPSDSDGVRVEVTPIWNTEPFVDRLLVRITPDSGQTFSREYREGRWIRRAETRMLQLRKQGQLQDNELCYRSLVATRNGQSIDVRPPVLEAPPIEDKTLHDLGVRDLDAGNLTPDRPVLVNSRLESEIIQRTRAAGEDETGGAVLGSLARLPEPLPGTTTPVVTVLAASVCDGRHEGKAASFNISPDAMVEAAQIAQVSGQRVMTIWHSHGWCEKKCEKMNNCPLVSPAYMSTDDYQVAETLCPSKATVMPICGWDRVDNDNPTLIVHGWNGGLMKAVPWMRYEP